MVLLNLEGFDHHGTSDANMDDYLDRKHSSIFGTFENETGRISGTALGTNATTDNIVFRFPSNHSEIIFGFAMKFRELNSNVTDNIVEILNQSNQTLCTFFRSANGVPALLEADNTSHFANNIQWKPFLWNYFEIRVLAGTNNSNGQIELRMNGESIINETGVDTFFSGQIGCTGAVLNGTDHYDPLYDDIYVIDTTGSVNNTWLGDVKVEALFPNGAGNSTQFSVTGAASNYQAVDDNPVDDDTSYVSSSTLNQKDTYAYENLSTITQSIKGVIVHTLAKKDSTGTRAITALIRSGTTDYSQDEYFLAYGDTDEYGFRSSVTDVDPDTSVAWTVSGVNSAQFGFEVTT
jgi:hypothetical protein